VGEVGYVLMTMRSKTEAWLDFANPPSRTRARASNAIALSIVQIVLDTSPSWVIIALLEIISETGV
jgi:hypothetical protein